MCCSHAEGARLPVTPHLPSGSFRFPQVTTQSPLATSYPRMMCLRRSSLQDMFSVGMRIRSTDHGILPSGTLNVPHSRAPPAHPPSSSHHIRRCAIAPEETISTSSTGLREVRSLGKVKVIWDLGVVVVVVVQKKLDCRLPPQLPSGSFRFPQVATSYHCLRQSNLQDVFNVGKETHHRTG